MLSRKQLTNRCYYEPRTGMILWYDPNIHPSHYSQQHISNVLLDQFASIATEEHFDYLIQQLKQHPVGPHGRNGEDRNPLHAKRKANLAWKRKKKDIHFQLCFEYSVSGTRKQFGNAGFWKWLEKKHYNQFRILKNKTKVAEQNKTSYNKRIISKKTTNKRSRYDKSTRTRKRFK